MPLDCGIHDGTINFLLKCVEGEKILIELPPCYEEQELQRWSDVYTIYTHHGDECHGHFGLYLMNLKHKNWVHNFLIYFGFSLIHRGSKVYQRNSSTCH